MVFEADELVAPEFPIRLTSVPLKSGAPDRGGCIPRSHMPAINLRAEAHVYPFDVLG